MKWEASKALRQFSITSEPAGGAQENEKDYKYKIEEEPEENVAKPHAKTSSKSDWQEIVTADGSVYYYNNTTG